MNNLQPITEPLIWISGATEGIGLGLARNAPWPDAHIINLSRRQHRDYPSYFLDLSIPESWQQVAEHFTDMLRHYRGTQAIFIQNAHMKGFTGFTGEGASEAYETDIIANVAAPLRLGEAFIRAVRSSGYAGTAGLVMLSSAAARSPYEGQSAYCAGKAAIEMWVRVVRRELLYRQQKNIWVTAVRPGFVDTALTRHVAAMPDHDYPVAGLMRGQMQAKQNVMDIDTAARQIWAALPSDQSLLIFGEQAQIAR